jgi:hypothetical protein
MTGILCDKNPVVLTCLLGVVSSTLWMASFKFNIKYSKDATRQPSLDIWRCWYRALLLRSDSVPRIRRILVWWPSPYSDQLQIQSLNYQAAGGCVQSDPTSHRCNLNASDTVLVEPVAWN